MALDKLANVLHGIDMARMAWHPKILLSDYMPDLFLADSRSPMASSSRCKVGDRAFEKMPAKLTFKPLPAPSSAFSCYFVLHCLQR